ncbi:uncharacterized protein Dvir_GJ22299 [Drosophila virilis]|uniref:C2H2-type domain-containing protein n=2 Tax=Drosophila virilis TaxID=7244 RepID=B4LLD2_DROVI|nr:uncharacterized protein Dvir_GJ22299 [Drosophila virilis]
MEAQFKDLWTCGFFLSKEPYKELAIRCFMCDRLCYTIREFQKHLALTHLNKEEEGINKPVSIKTSPLNNDPYLGLCEVETALQLAEVVSKINTCDRLEEEEISYENYCAEKLEYPITESIVDSVQQATTPATENIICEQSKKQEQCKKFKKRASKTKKDDFVCEQCGLIFKERFRLQEHQRVAHEKLRRFLCSKCPKTYARKTHLNDHMRSHSQQRDFVCNVCDKAFRRSQELTRHKLRHQPAKNYSCQRCDAKFRQHSGLYYHVKIKHSKHKVKAGAC